MQGCGNDFIVIDAADGPWSVDVARSRALCDRRFGVGADGVLLIGEPRGRRWPVEIHNADGSIAEACGNGSRCVVRYLLDRHGHGDRLELATRGGLVNGWRDPEGIAIALDPPSLGEPFEVVVERRRIAGRRVRAGNPNLVLFVDDPEREDLARLPPPAPGGPRGGHREPRAGARWAPCATARSRSGWTSGGSARRSPAARAPARRRRRRWRPGACSAIRSG